MAAHINDVLCLHVQDVDRAVKMYQDQGCTIKRHSRKGTFLDCDESNVFNAQAAEKKELKTSDLDREWNDVVEDSDHFI